MVVFLPGKKKTMAALRPVFGLVEHFLFEYDTMIKALRDESPLVPTMFLVNSLKRVLAVNEALNNLPSCCRQFFELNYRQKLPKSEVCTKLGIDTKSFSRCRQRIIFAAAWELGFILPPKKLVNSVSCPREA